MRKMKISALLVIVALLAFSSMVSAAPDGPGVFLAPLSGDQEVPARETDALGKAGFLLSQDGTSLSYLLMVAKIENVTASHIHCAPAGQNGPVGVTLYMGSAASGPISGLIASGVITAPDAGNGCGWVTLDDVLAAIYSGGAYVNVHTNDGVAPTNTGPGDFPGGEIRGQIFEASN